MFIGFVLPQAAENRGFARAARTALAQWRDAVQAFYTHSRDRNKRPGPRPTCLAVWVASWLNVAAHSHAAAPDDAALQNELSNVRALPYGYRAVCEAGDLKIKSSLSATFVIRSSRLCLGWHGNSDAPQRKSFVLCSNDPQNPGPAGTPVSECAALELLWAK